MKEAYQKTIEEIYSEYQTNKEGLSDKEAERRLGLFGKNVLIQKNKKSKWKIFLSQFKNIMVILLLLVGVMSLVYAIFTSGDFLEPIVILGTSLINCLMGYFQESKAEDALEKLKNYSSAKAKVKRGGDITEIDAKDLVRGDYIILEAGDKIPADARIVESYFAKCDESILTGESMSVDKTEETITKKALIAERTDMVYSGTILVAGKIEAVVTDTGMNTELGKIASTLDSKEEPITPLQVKVNKISTFISCVAAILVAFVLCYGLIMDYTLLNVVMLCISMIVASVPECLPIAITATLSIGVSQMAKKKSIVRNLAAIETLGATEVICTDKTGTLTTNQMEILKVYTNGNLIPLEDIKNYQTFINIMLCCNNSTKDDDGKYRGDAVEVALNQYLEKQKIDVETLQKKKKRVLELPFDSKRKMMSTIYEENNGKVIYTKGSLESLLPRCKSVLIDGKIKPLTAEIKAEYEEMETQLSQEALKVLAFATKEITHDRKEEAEYFKEESDLILVGLTGFKDPARKDVKAAIQECKEAHIRPIMITGDNLETALSIGKEVGICSSDDEGVNASELTHLSKDDWIEYVNKYSVFARVSPEAKVQIVTALQRMGKVVAMTGDGVNDAPALKKSDIGCAMGVVGTDVAKEAADVILTDDNFATVVSAVEEGRRIYDNILKSISFLLSSNVGEIVVLFIAILITPWLASTFGIPQEYINALEPLLPIQILWVNLVTDSLPALALAYDPAEKDVMNRKPKKNSKGVFTKGITFRVVYQGVMIGLLTLTAFILGLTTTEAVDGLTLEETKIETAQTMAFAVLAFSELVHVFNVRNSKKSLFKSNPFNNKYLLLAILVSAVLMFAVLLIPALRSIFSIIVLPMDKLAETIALVLAPIVIVEIMKLLKINSTKDE